MNIWVGSSRYVVFSRSRVWYMALIYARSIFCSLGSLYEILRFLKGLYIPCPVFSRFQCPLLVSLGGLNDPFV
jgi:hypothetical protein